MELNGFSGGGKKKKKKKGFSKIIPCCNKWANLEPKLSFALKAPDAL